MFLFQLCSICRLHSKYFSHPKCFHKRLKHLQGCVVSTSATLKVSSLVGNLELIVFQRVQLCQQILVIEPFWYRPRTNQSGSAWSKVAGELNKMPSLQMKVVDQRAVRDRFKTIKKKFQDKMKAEETGSGIAPPELTPVENAIEDIIERELEMEILHGEEDDEKNKKLEKDKKTAEEMRLQSLETFSETRKRKAENSDEDDQNPKPKKTRRSGSPTLLYLREKAQLDMEFKKEELQLKKEEQAKQFEEQMAMRQQQSELLKSFTDVQQSMQSQMQKQAELQQQQMQQNNQIMMMMMQSMKKN